MNEASTDKQQFWLDHIEAANSSGLSIVQYAKQHDIKAQSLYQWRNAIKHKIQHCLHSRHVHACRDFNTASLRQSDSQDNGCDPGV